MSEQLERAVQFLNPVSGEVLTLTARSDDLGRYLADIREFESVIREHKKMVTRELLNRFDKQATWTHRFEGGLKITGQSPQPSEEWDGAELREALLGLVDEGVLSIEAVDAAVETVVSYKPRKAGISALRKLGGRVAETVNGLCREVEKERRISVSRVSDLSHPAAIIERLAEIEADLARVQNAWEDAALRWFKAKRDREKARAVAFLSAEGTVAERSAIADRDTATDGVNDEALYESLKAVVRTLETRASIGQSLLKAQSRSGFEGHSEMAATGRYGR